MKENSNEEDIKDIEKYISFTSKRENFSHDTDWNWNKDLANKTEHILSNYKRVLKENERLKAKIDICDWQEKSCREIIESKHIPIQKIKDKIEELNRKIDNGGKTYGRYGGCVINSENIMKLQNQIEALQELLEKE